MQEKESVMVVRFELKITSLGITVRHHSARLVMPNSYPRNGIFNPNLMAIKDSYKFAWACHPRDFQVSVATLCFCRVLIFVSL